MAEQHAPASRTYRTVASIGVSDRPQLFGRHPLRYSVAQGGICDVIERTQEDQLLHDRRDNTSQLWQMPATLAAWLLTPQEHRRSH
jgi:hypothetical protein